MILFQSVVDVRVQCNLALFCFFNHRSGELFDCLVLTILLHGWVIEMRFHGPMAWSKYPVSDRRWLRWQACPLSESILVGKAALHASWHITAEPFHSMWYSCRLRHELEFLSVQYQLCVPHISWLILSWLVKLHWNLAASDRVSQIFSYLIVLNLTHCASLHLSQLLGFEHSEGVCHINWALLIMVVRRPLIINLYWTIVPAGMGAG